MASFFPIHFLTLLLRRTVTRHPRLTFGCHHGFTLFVLCWLYIARAIAYTPIELAAMFDGILKIAKSIFYIRTPEQTSSGNMRTCCIRLFGRCRPVRNEIKTWAEEERIENEEKTRRREKKKDFLLFGSFRLVEWWNRCRCRVSTTPANRFVYTHGESVWSF